jgi:hypothetical protein
MIEDQFLPYFITEEIYMVSERIQQDKQVSDENSAVNEPDPQIQKDAKDSIELPEERVHELAIWTPPLTTQDKAFIGKILNAIHKNMESAFVMEGVDSYKPQFKTLLCFGYQKELELKAGKSVSLYNPVTIDHRTFLTAVSPAELAADTKQKALLWEALQKVFL